jgi:hypothetical protein
MNVESNVVCISLIVFAVGWVAIKCNPLYG